MNSFFNSTPQNSRKFRNIDEVLIETLRMSPCFPTGFSFLSMSPQQRGFLADNKGRAMNPPSFS